jgi:hypothetical protein
MRSRNNGPSLLLAALLLGTTSGGCWKMQDLGYGNDTDSTTVTDSDSDSDTDTWTDPWPETLEMCDIDILFVFDTSQSMMLTVQALANEGFGGFTTMLASYPQPGTINVAMTNHLYGNHFLGPSTINCSEFLIRGMDVPVNTAICQDIPTKACNFESGEVWIEGPSETLKDEFNCVGRLPCQEDTSHEEETIQAGLEALEDPYNAGFIREDALLFLIFVSDENDASEMPADEIRQGLLDLKDGDEDAVYVASMAGGYNSGCSDSGFFGEADATPAFIDFVELFGDNGRHYNMCNTNMSTALASMVSLLTDACQAEL